MPLSPDKRKAEAELLSKLPERKYPPPKRNPNPPTVCIEPGCRKPVASTVTGLCVNHNSQEHYRQARTGPGLWEAYRAHLEGRRYRDRTIRRYRDLLYDFWSFTGHMQDPKNVTKKNLQAYLSRTSNSPRSRGRRITTTTASNEGQLLRAAYRWFADEALLGRNRNPLANYPLPRPTIGPPRCLPATEVERLLRKAEGSNHRIATMLHLAYWCGMRSGEIARLKIEDITPGYAGQPMTVLIDGKGGKQRRVPVHPEAAAWLEGYLADRPRSGPVVERTDQPGVAIGANLVSRSVGDYMKRNGVKESAHSLRHSRATHMLMQSPNGDLRPLQRFLGHASSKTTERYTDAWDGELNKLATM
jgi:site-specific recombinase XerD